MTAPKLTEAQRERLTFYAGLSVSIPTVFYPETVTQLEAMGLVKRDAFRQFRITDAGRAALRGES